MCSGYKQLKKERAAAEVHCGSSWHPFSRNKGSNPRYESQLT
jgi:hypothetical protein